MRFGTLAASCALLFGSLSVHADDLFVFQTASDTLSFTLPASPVPPFQAPGGYFEVFTIETLNGTVLGSMRIDFNSAAHGGGFADDNYSLFGAQLYTGTEAAPTFVPATYSFTGASLAPLQQVSGTLTITAQQANTPEPSSLVLFATGLLGLACVSRKRLA